MISQHKDILKKDTLLKKSKNKFSNITADKKVVNKRTLPYKFYQLAIKKRLTYTFAYIGIIALFIAAIALFNMKSIESKLNRFYNGPYAIEENVLKAQVAMGKIENNIYRAYITNNDEFVNKYIQTSENEYKIIEQSISELSKNIPAQDVESISHIKNLENERKKGDRYRTRILESAKMSDQNKIYDIYRNDYAPILSHLLTEFEDIEQLSIQYVHNYVKQANSQVNESIIIFILFIIIGAGSCIFILRVLEKSITSPLAEIKSAMQEIEKGNLEVNITYVSADETGILCDTVRETSKKLKGYIHNITDVIKKLEEKDMTARVLINYDGDFKPIQTSLDRIIITFQNMLNTINNTSGQITIGAEKIAQTSRAVAEGSTEQAGEISNLVNQIDQIAAAINTNAKNTDSIQNLSNDTVRAANQGNEQINMLVHALEAIADHSGRISKVIKLINEIADQTNLLSLNATIEAARAGNAGKGFGVVANEIGKLADECGKAATSTADLIGGSINAMREGVSLAKETAEEFQEIVNVSMETNKVMEDMSKGAAKQAKQLNDTLKYLQHISTIIESNSAAAQESSAMSEEFTLHAEKLEKMLQEYKLI